MARTGSPIHQFFFEVRVTRLTCILDCDCGGGLNSDGEASEPVIALFIAGRMSCMMTVMVVEEDKVGHHTSTCAVNAWCGSFSTRQQCMQRQSERSVKIKDK